MQARSDTRVFLGITLSLVAFAWLSILVWGASPYGAYLHHEGLAHVRSPLSTSFAERVALFLVGWALMIVAMMLPTILPLVSLFRSITRTRPNRTRLVVLVFAGYVAAWGIFGAVAYMFDLGVHKAVAAVPLLSSRPSLVTVAVLLTTGLYQFTPLKYYCLDKCRSPYAFVMSRWHGASPQADAFRLGTEHGLFCVGCCWSIMLLLFAIGTGNAAWMAAVAIVMGIEKNASWGKQLTPALGIVLVTASITLLLTGAPDTACAC